jgi:hypothetical protein
MVVEARIIDYYETYRCEEISSVKKYILVKRRMLL